jgi:hypothetical protein
VKKLSALVSVFVLVACGKRGDPQPPVPIIPQATSDLVVTQRADNVILSWSYPALTTAGRSLTSVHRISIYRYDEELPVPAAGRDASSLQPGNVDPTQPQPLALFSRVPTITQVQFAKLSHRIYSIEKANLPAATAGAKLVYTDTPPTRSSDGRPVRVSYAVVTEGGTTRSDYSNLAILVPLPVAVPPASLTATAKPEGVALSWTAPAKTTGGASGPTIGGYNIYRTGVNEELAELPTPINPSPVMTTSYTDVPPYGEHAYRVTAVASASTPIVQSDPSQPVRVTFKDLVAPPQPTGLEPLIENNGIRLFWEPVNASDLAGYLIYRTEGTGHNPPRPVGTLKFVTTPQTETTYVNSPVTQGIAFRYGVTAIDKSGNESATTWTDWLVVPKTP